MYFNPTMFILLRDKRNLLSLANKQDIVTAVMKKKHKQSSLIANHRVVIKNSIQASLKKIIKSISSIDGFHFIRLLNITLFQNNTGSVSWHM